MPADSPFPPAPDDRRHALARLLAAGLRRLLAPAASPVSPSKNLENSTPNGLELVPQKSVTVHTS